MWRDVTNIKIMKRIYKILLAIPVVLLLGIIILWQVVRYKPAWDNSRGHPIEKATIEKEGFTKVSDLKWASPQGFNLTMDIYTPKAEQESFPVIIIYHGGGWLMNDKRIMDDMSTYLANTGKYVVCNVNYRLFSDQKNSVKLNEIIEDAFGAVSWVKSNISQYKGDAARIIVTGDSAGGHMAAIVTLQGKDLDSRGFKDQPYGFNPTWLPEDKTSEDIAQENGLAVQAAIISYGGFDVLRSAEGGMEKWSNIFWAVGSSWPRGILGPDINVNEHPDFYKKVSPYYNYPTSSAQALPPMLFTAGEKDPLIKPADVQAFVKKLQEAGHEEISYWEAEGQSHAFLDSGKSFEEKAVPTLEVMVDFLDEIFY